MKSLFEVDIFIKTQLTLPSGEGEITTGYCEGGLRRLSRRHRGPCMRKSDGEKRARVRRESLEESLLKGHLFSISDMGWVRIYP